MWSAMCGCWAGRAHSVTFHGPEEFDGPHTLLLRDKVAEARFAVAVSANGRSQLARWATFDAWDRIKVVHCGIDPPVRGAGSLPPGPDAHDPLRVVCIGRFAEQKGQVLLIEAMARCTAPVHLTLVVDGPLRAEISGRSGRTGWTYARHAGRLAGRDRRARRAVCGTSSWPCPALPKACPWP